MRSFHRRKKKRGGRAGLPGPVAPVPAAANVRQSSGDQREALRSDSYRPAPDGGGNGLGAWIGGAEIYDNEDSHLAAGPAGDERVPRRRRASPPTQPPARRGSLFAADAGPHATRWAYDVDPGADAANENPAGKSYGAPPRLYHRDYDHGHERHDDHDHGQQQPQQQQQQAYGHGQYGSAGASTRRSTVWKVTADAMSGTKADLLKRYDRAVFARVALISGNALFSVLQMIAWNQSTGDGDAIGSNRFDVSTGITRTAQESLMLLGTLLLMGQLVEYYLHQRRYEGRSWHILDSRQWAQWRWTLLAIELAVVVVHPYPGCDLTSGRYAATFMFARLYTMCRLVRNLSASYRSRDQILRSRAFRSAGSVQFSWAFCFRILFMSNPWVFVVIAVVYSLCSVAYTLYIFERVVPLTEVSGPWTLRVALWCTVITMTTVGYGDTIPYSQEGRIVAAVSALIGVVLASILIFIIINSLTPSLLERHAHTIRKARWWSARLEYLSTRYLQLWMRMFLWRRGKGPRVKDFELRNNALKAKIRAIRRKIALLEIDTIKAVEELELAKIDQQGAGNLAGVIGGESNRGPGILDGPMVDARGALALGLGPHNSRSRPRHNDDDDDDDGDQLAGADDNDIFDDDDDDGSCGDRGGGGYGGGGPRSGGVSLRRIAHEQRLLRQSVEAMARNQELILELLNRR